VLNLLRLAEGAGNTVAWIGELVNSRLGGKAGPKRLQLSEFYKATFTGAASRRPYAEKATAKTQSQDGRAETPPSFSGMWREIWARGNRRE
jgi:hypothetical protein